MEIKVPSGAGTTHMQSKKNLITLQAFRSKKEKSYTFQWTIVTDDYHVLERNMIIKTA